MQLKFSENVTINCNNKCWSTPTSLGRANALFLFNTGGRNIFFPNGLYSMLTVLLPLFPFCLNNGSPQILWILRRKLWILCCQFAFFASSFKFTHNWIFWQICNSSFQIRLKLRKIWEMLVEISLSNWSERIRLKSWLRT